MIIDTSPTIAYKCSSCGTYDFVNISLFKLSSKKQSVLKCRCREPGIALVEEECLKYKMNVPCIACGENHVFALGAKELLTSCVSVFYCPATGIQLCFIGNDMQVRKKIDALEQELDKMIDMLGYDSYFKNTRVMFDSLNRIHDIAEQGNLICECGNRDIQLVLFSDTIQLKCSRCPGSVLIRAASNEDLKNILKIRQIFLRELQNTIFEK